MASGTPKTLEGEGPSQSPSSPPSPSSTSSDGWKERVFIPTLLAGIVGGGVGLVSKHRKVHGLADIAATYATNFAIVTGCYCGTREFVRVTRKSDPDDLFNSPIAGVFSGAILGRLQGGPAGAAKYSVIFAVAGTTLDFVINKLKASFRDISEEEKKNWFKLPDWSPIQVLDEEAQAKKEAREKQLYAERVLGKLNKEKS
ncbi:hypothetical protein L484_007012 [Morus notabilis]|uniref:Mitochondrial import inner membrane translocase subunit Tim17/Tim22/Tim23 family protein n=1 Tax=Morus notabilis TaxID=981085 RepID=W9RMT8_9ROSA|nr:uncharacterized protein LOC21390425 [Morus notabilis]EXB99104.1 hypothetical protein L484_007012 [Morus notabilis]